jgi:2-keto-4-pentenoate hydratase/2-oxohepta-3-ene-1,7-dioic acid hydratase in catechol pathway
MYVNYSKEGRMYLGYLDGDRLLSLEGPPLDALLGGGLPLVPRSAPVETGPVTFLPPLLHVRSIFCLMRSYRKHAEELGNRPPPAPNFFAKLANSVTGHGWPIVIPADVPGEVHHEGELALVIGEGGRNIAAADAMDHVFGYTIANDVTARTLQGNLKEKGWPWLSAKSRDTFLPLGPGIVPREKIDDPAELGLTVEVNGETRQSAPVADLLWPVAEIVAHASRLYRLSRGDIILTGTPEGVGPLVPGDTVSVVIDGLGRLSNPVVAEEA